MDTHEIKKKRGKIVSLSSGMHRKLLAFYGKGENVILLKFWKQQLYTRLLFFCPVLPDDLKNILTEVLILL